MDDMSPGKSPSEDKSQEEIQAWLVGQVAALTFAESSKIDVNAPFNSYGLSSRDAVMLSGDLEEWLNRRLSPTLVYEYPTIAALAEHLGNQSNQQPVGMDEANVQNARVEPDNLYHAVPELSRDERLADIEQISDDEAEALLLEQLNKLNQKK
jgi:acyl carrier protein